MAVIHRTTMEPGKLDLVRPWLAAQPWSLAGPAPQLSKAGGFRLDDPQGEVGIEFLFLTDSSGADPVSYSVPLSYRGRPLEDAGHALLGTSEHGVLGRRWIYDGAHDPVVAAALEALVAGRATAQDQNQSDTPDPSVTCTAVPAATGAVVELVRILRPGRPAGATGYVEAGWSLPDGTAVRGAVALVR